ncbi:MAG: hypothetical protein Kilf2KO_26980 [Rhodospirillales bacterium]
MPYHSRADKFKAVADATDRRPGDEVTLPYDSLLAEVLLEELAQEDLARPLAAPLHMAWRRGGRLLHETWQQAETLRNALAALSQEAPDGAESALLCLPLDCWSVAETAWHGVFADAQRGILGLGLACEGWRDWLAPTQLVASNRNFSRGLEHRLAARGLDLPAFRGQGGRLSAFTARQILVHLGREPHCQGLLRGNRVRALPEKLDTMLEEAAGWLLRQQRPDGSLAYKYWPSRGEGSTTNNTIRQFMASLALIDWASYRGRAPLLVAATRSLEANLEAFLRHEGDLAVIEHEGKAKLGAAALAALCLLRHPDRAAYAAERRALERGIAKLWQADGSFRTFHRPADRNDNQNFYPGEALYYWSERLRGEPDDALSEAVSRSLDHYRRFHRRAPNPAFVPWHSLALAGLDPSPARSRYLFAMNDWLVGLQQWESAPHRDMAGRFYAPEHPDYGPPHASSTGVYIEGLAAAFSVAERLGDRARAARYATAVWRGLRSLRQLQFLDESDCFYVSKRDRVLGGLRSEVYDNTLRIDNTQHALAALLAVARQPALLAARPAPSALEPPDKSSAAGFASQ